jgi:DNA polymerase-3 subunit delta'
MAAAKEQDQPQRIPVEPGEVRATMQAQARVRGHMDALAAAPPQVLLLEGGTLRQRELAALYWSLACNCEAGERPCLECHACRRLLGWSHRDMVLLDGHEASIKIDEVRQVRQVLGEPPRDARVRVIVLHEAQNLGIEAANALLKSLEEPRPGNSFLLLTPQRERLLPTLVSRSFVLTLAWPSTLPQAAPGPLDAQAPEVPDSAGDAVREWAAALHEFLVTGRGWFQRTAPKGAVDRNLAMGLTLHCQRELLAIHTGRAASPLSRHLAETLDPAGLRRLDVALGASQDALDAGVNPALVLDWLAVTLHTGC